MSDADRLTALSDAALVAVLRWLAAGGGDAPEAVDVRTAQGVALMASDWARMASSAADPAEKASLRESLDGFWGVVRTNGIPALRAEADARAPEQGQAGSGTRYVSRQPTTYHRFSESLRAPTFSKA